MISLSQIKAARALLGWTQDELAKAAGLSLPSINNLERGLYSPRPETYQAIVRALEEGGIEFLLDNGLRLKRGDHSIINFTGPHFLRDLDHDILSVLENDGQEIVGCTYDDRKWMEYGAVSNPMYVEARAKICWRERFLIPQTAHYITSPPQSYRTLPPQFFGTMNYEIYGNRLALIEFDAMRVTLIKNDRIAMMFLKQFDMMWSSAKPFTAAQIKKIEKLDFSKKAGK